MLQPTTAAQLSARVRTEQASSRLPSIVAGVVRHGELAWSHAAGYLDGRPEGPPADAQAQYRIGSITKTFVGVAVMRLRDEGRLDLSDRLDAYVPGTAFGQVTIAQLLSHASGLQAETDGPWWERTPGGEWEPLAASLAGLRHRPGRRFHYSNPGFAALGEVVSRLRGASWDEVVRRELLTPLGMSRTTARPQTPYAPGLAVHPYADLVLPEPEHDAGAMAPAGQLWSTVGDLGRWAAFLGGETGDVLSADTLAEMREPLVVDDTPGAAWTGAYGLGIQVWNVDGQRFVGHGGSMPGYLAGLRVDVASGDGVVVMTNSTAGLSRTISSDLLATLATAEPIAPDPWHTDEVAPEVLDIVGAWFWGPSPFTLHARTDDWLELVSVNGGRGSRFRPVGQDRWVGLDGYYAGEVLRVVRRGDGAVRHLDLASFVFTRTPYDPSAEIPGGLDDRGWH